MKTLIIAGITGSIGDSTLKVLRKYSNDFKLIGFSFHDNLEKAIAIAEEFQCKHVSCTSEITKEIGSIFASKNIDLFSNIEDLLDLEFDAFLNAVVGASGVRPTLKAAQAGRTILLANKETLVMAGDFLTRTAKENKATIFPVDSEHSSLFRLIDNKKRSEIDSLILTASGGPLRTFSIEQMQRVTKKEVLNHPTWSMGDKITVDSAGMINKALEVIEAHHLFDFKYEKIEAVIHAQSYVHAITRECDGSFQFHVSQPDMIFPICYALYYPEPAKAVLDFESVNDLPDLSFEKIDLVKFKGYKLGLQAAKLGGCYPSIFNAANEKAVADFLQDKISFSQISEHIETKLNNSKFTSAPSSLEELFEADKWARL